MAAPERHRDGDAELGARRTRGLGRVQGPGAQARVPQFRRRRPCSSRTISSCGLPRRRRATTRSPNAFRTASIPVFPSMANLSRTRRGRDAPTSRPTPKSRNSPSCGAGMPRCSRGLSMDDEGGTRPGERRGVSGGAALPQPGGPRFLEPARLCGVARPADRGHQVCRDRARIPVRRNPARSTTPSSTRMPTRSGCGLLQIGDPRLTRAENPATLTRRFVSNFEVEVAARPDDYVRAQQSPALPPARHGARRRLLCRPAA